MTAARGAARCRECGRNRARTARSPRAPGAERSAAPSLHGVAKTRSQNPALQSHLAGDSTGAKENTGGPPCMGPPPHDFKGMRLLRIQLDDQVLVDVRQYVVPARRRLEYATELLVVHLDPVRQAHLLGHVQCA